jgi:hypothetical protein
MKHLIRLAAKLYPGPWRDRYGEEFEALLDDAGINGRIAFNVLTGAVLMQVQRWQKVGTAALLAMGALFAASWWVGQRPYISPGTHQVFRMDSTLGFLVEFLVLLSLVVVGLITLLAGRGRWICACIAASYMAAVVLVSLLTPRTIVSIGDSYCWDLWCVGIQNVNATPQGQNILYKAEVSLFSDATTVQLEVTDQPKRFFYLMDERGRRFPILAYSSLAGPSVTVKPGESVKSSLTFLAPADARKLYLTDDLKWPPWVNLYFGSDLNPFHRRTLLRVV